MIMFCAMAVLSYLPPEVFDAGRSSFSINYRDETADYRIQSTFILPGEVLEVKVVSPASGRSYSAVMDGRQWAPISNGSWQWVAPQKVGHQLLTIGYGEAEDQIELNIFIMEPFSSVQDGVLNGFRIGKYPAKPLRDNPVYLPPRGFVELTPEMMSLQVSPHFTLGQFVCKQAGGYPKYLVLRSRLLLKLEFLLELANKKGLACQSFHIMSGFRTPFYNKAIGNVKYSRHQWGGAVDIFIDESPRDGYPDDLNGDGKINRKDAMVLYEMIDAEVHSRQFKVFVGGLGLYKANGSHGPFVHVDVRGFKARWGE